MKRVLLYILVMITLSFFGKAQIITVKQLPDSIYTEGLSTKHNSDLTIDSTGNIWLTTYGGIVKMSDNFNILDYFSESNSELPHFVCEALAIDTSNHLWVGSGGGLLAEFDMDENWITYSPYYDVANIKVNNYNHVYFHSWNSGIAYYDRTEFHWYNTLNSDIPSDNTTDMELQNDSVLWVGTWDGGVSKFFSGEFINYNTDNSIIPSSVVHGIEIDTNNIVYCGTDSGIYYFNDYFWANIDCINDSILLGKCDPIFVDSENYLWFTANTMNNDKFLIRYKEGDNYLIEEEQLDILLFVRTNSLIELSPGKFALMSNVGDYNDIAIIDFTNNIESGEIDNNELSIFPNPCADYINVKSKKAVESVNLLQLSGIMKNSYTKIDPYNFKICIKPYKAGLYILNFTYSDKTAEQKTIIKQ